MVLLNSFTPPRFTAAEERAMNDRRLAGDTEAREQLILSVLQWAIKLAKARLPYVKHDDTMAEAFSVGGLAAIDAVDTFNPNRGRLTTYTVFKVMRQMNLMKLQEQKLTLDGLLPKAVRFTGYREVRDSVVNHFSAAGLRIENYNGCRNPVEDDVLEAERRQQLQQMYKLTEQLPHRYRIVLQGCMAGTRLTEIGKAIGITKEGVRQNKEKALEELFDLLTPKQLAYWRLHMPKLTRPPGYDIRAKLTRQQVADIAKFGRYSETTIAATAREFGINRHTVAIIFRGKHPFQRAPEQAKSSVMPMGIVYPDLESELTPCPHCHVMVKAPCLVCQVRRPVKEAVDDNVVQLGPFKIYKDRKRVGIHGAAS